MSSPRIPTLRCASTSSATASRRSRGRDPTSNRHLTQYDHLRIYPANIFVTGKDRLKNAIHQIEIDLGERVEYFTAAGQLLEAKRLKERTEFDLEMIRELGYCSGIENYFPIPGVAGNRAAAHFACWTTFPRIF